MKKKKENGVKINNFPLIVAFIFFLILILRLAHLSLSIEVDGINLHEFAKTRTTRKTVLSAKRGNIYDGNGNILGQDVSSYTLIAYLDPKRTINENNPQHVVDKENTALVLSAILDIDYETLLKYLSKENVYQTEFGSKGRGLSELVKDRIIDTKLPGLDFIETKKRYYPYGDFASYLVGYAKEDKDGNVIGELGIEKSFNDKLTGKDGYTIYQKDRNGYKIAGTSEVREDAIDGENVYLTIDSNVQFFTEKALSKRTNDDNDEITIVVADAKDGKILSYATNPSFNPNKRNITNYMDPIASTAFEPGSTMKIYTYMAALESGVYEGKAKYQSGSFTTKDKTVIRDWNNVGWGYITFDQGFIYSSNTAVVNIMDKYMDDKTLKNYLLKLGFGSKTEIEVPLEASGKISFKYETEIFNAAFGQGITTTPIQHIKALTSIANNGDLLKPYIVDKITDANGNVVYQNKRTVLDHVASSDTIAYIKNLMWHTVNDRDGAGHSYAIDGYNIIGKTGTAQIAKTNGKGYLSGYRDLNRSVAIMYPKDDPKIIIYAVAKRASGINELAPIVKEIITNVSKYYNIYNEEENKIQNNEQEINNYLNLDVTKVKDDLENNGLEVYILGNGNKIIDTYPKPKTKVIKGDKVFLLTNGDKYIMPNIIKFSKSEVKTLCNLLDLEVTIKGNGYVESQSISEGTELTKDSYLEVEMKLLY